MMRFFRTFMDLGIRGMSARWYDNNTRTHRMDEMRALAKNVSEKLSGGSSVLEIAPGPGYLSIELAKMGDYRITGMDISADFVEIARKNAAEAGVRAEFMQGNVSAIPLKDGMFDFIVCTAAFKNFKEPVKALNEMYRVLKPGGTAMINDMNRNASAQSIDELVKNMGMKGFGAFYIKQVFKVLRNGAYTKGEFTDMFAKTQFKKYDINEQGIGFSIYLYK